MTHPLSEEALDTLFREARSFSDWQERAVDDALLQQLYELAKWGPTAANVGARDGTRRPGGPRRRGRPQPTPASPPPRAGPPPAPRGARRFTGFRGAEPCRVGGLREGWGELWE